MQKYSKILNSILLNYRSVFGQIPKPKKWVFIVGCYNSGTTLLHKILSCHHLIGSMPIEGQMCSNQFVTPKQLGIPRLWATKKHHFHLIESSTPTSVSIKLKRQWGHCFNDLNRPILIEKSITNAARIRWLNQNFENAYFISLIRNGYAVAEGIKRKTGQDISLAARQWAISNQIMLEDLKKVPNKMDITYEEFTQSPELTLKAIADFIGVENTFIQNGVTAKNWSIHGVTSQIQNMNQVSLERLDVNERQLIEDEAISMLQKFGYYKK